MKVEIVTLPPFPDPSAPDTTSDEMNLSSLDVSIEKLVLVLGITFAFILLLLFSLICIFYVMGFLQNVLGYSWATPMGRTISSPHSFYFPDEVISDANSSHHHSRCPSSQSHHRAAVPCNHVTYGGVIESR